MPDTPCQVAVRKHLAGRYSDRLSNKKKWFFSIVSDILSIGKVDSMDWRFTPEQLKRLEHGLRGTSWMLLATKKMEQKKQKG